MCIYIYIYVYVSMFESTLKNCGFWWMSIPFFCTVHEKSGKNRAYMGMYGYMDMSHNTHYYRFSIHSQNSSRCKVWPFPKSNGFPRDDLSAVRSLHVRLHLVKG